MELTGSKLKLVQVLNDPVKYSWKTRDDLARHVGVTRMTIYRHLNDDDVIEAINKNAVRAVMPRIPRIINKQCEQAEEGDNVSARNVLDYVNKHSTVAGEGSGSPADELIRAVRRVVREG